MIEVQCTQCKDFIARYKGSGELDLLFLDRVLKPNSLANLKSSNKTDLPHLICNGCNRKLGRPVEDEKGRLAYKMIKGSFRRKAVIKAMTPSPHTSWRQPIDVDTMGPFSKNQTAPLYYLLKFNFLRENNEQNRKNCPDCSWRSNGDSFFHYVEKSWRWTHHCSPVCSLIKIFFDQCQPFQ